MADHLLPPRYVEELVSVDIVGCGGNGSQMLTGVARLDRALRALGHPGFVVNAWDPDTVSEANVGRQLFSPADVGLNKAAVLVHRLNAFYGLDWASNSTRFFAHDESALVITCVDTARARVEIGDSIHGRAGPVYWMDLGNRNADGQVVLGQVLPRHIKPAKDAPLLLPTVLDLFPEMARGTVADDDAPSCSLAEALERQELFINQAVVTQALAILWTLFRFGRISWHGAFVNLRTGRTQPLPVDPEAWARMGYPKQHESRKGSRT